MGEKNPRLLMDRKSLFKGKLKGALKMEPERQVNLSANALRSPFRARRRMK
jgi:hypothetical protein